MTLPEREMPTLVKEELGVWGLYWQTSWSLRISHSRTWPHKNRVIISSHIISEKKLFGKDFATIVNLRHHADRFVLAAGEEAVGAGVEAHRVHVRLVAPEGLDAAWSREQHGRRSGQVTMFNLV